MHEPQTFRVTSYNIRKAIGGDLRRDPARILDVVGAIGADIVALQEGDFRFRARAPLFDAAEVRQRTGLTAIDLATGLPALGWHGNVVFVGPRLRVVSVALQALPGLEPRGMITADLEIASRPLRVVVAHLALFPHHRRRQVDLLMRSLGLPEAGRDTDLGADLAAGPAIVMGDFNAWGRAPRSLAPLLDSMTEIVCGPSFPARLPVAPLDRIFHRGALSRVASGVWRDAPAGIASDHLPIWADLKLD